MDELMLDGNAVAGLLGEVFAVDMTTVMGRCARCGAGGPMGAAHAFSGAGIVLRCATCDHVLMTVVSDEGRTWIGFPGAVTLQIPGDAT